MTNNEMKDRILNNVKENIAISNIKEELKNENKTNKNVIYSMLSACAVVLLVGIVIINSPFSNVIDNNQNIDDFNDEPFETNIVKNIININRLEKPIEMEVNGIALFLNHFRALSEEELEGYYKTKVIPNHIPESLKLNEKQFGIFERDENIYYDQNSLIYENKDNNQKLNITVAKEAKIHYDFDYRNDIEKTYNLSKINDKDIAIFNFEYEEYIDTPIKYNCYYTYFEKDGTCFDITSCNIELDDFINILSLLI